MEVYWIPITLGTGFFIMMILMSYFRSKSKSDRARYQAEVQARLIDKFGNGPEFVQFLQSPQGRQFMGDIESAPKLMTQDRMLSGIGRWPNLRAFFERMQQRESVRHVLRFEGLLEEEPAG